MWYSRAFTARPRTVLDHLDCLWIASRHKPSLVRTTKLRKWTTEEDRRLLGLYEQAVKEERYWPKFIAKELGDRTVSAVVSRFYLHRHGAVEYSSHREWSGDEDSILREKLQQGIPVAELQKYLPSRSLNAIKGRIEHLRTITGTIPQEGFTSVQIQRAIHMRVREQKSRAEAAASLNVTCRISNACGNATVLLCYPRMILTRYMLGGTGVRKRQTV